MAPCTSIEGVQWLFNTIGQRHGAGQDGDDWRSIQILFGAYLDVDGEANVLDQVMPIYSRI